MSRKEFLVKRRKEEKVIAELTAKIIAKYPELCPENTLVLMVSPDYSATVAMHVAHSLS